MSSFGDQVKPQPEKAGTHHELVKTLISLASLLVAVIGVASRDLPWWAIVPLGLVIAILLTFISWGPAQTVSKAWRRKRSRDRVARMYFSELEHMLTRFLRELSDTNTNNLAYELRNITGMRDKNGNVVLEPVSDLQRVSEWLHLLANQANHRRTSDFLDFAKALNLAGTQYWWFCYNLQNRLQGIAAQGLLSEPDLRKVKLAWNNGREGANRFLVDWSELIERVNRESIESVGGIDRSTLKSIE